MRVLLLNDTRPARHVGCSLVMQNTLEQCQRTGIEIVASLSTWDDGDERMVRERLDAFDLLLINGEGTMHHDRPKAMSLANAARAAHEGGKRTVLYNTVWQANSALNRYLPAFDQIYCRESRSAAEIAKAGRRAIVTPDMVFATRGIEHLKQTRGFGIAVLDSVDRKVTRIFDRDAALRRFEYMPMCHDSFERSQRRWILRCLRAAWGASPIQNPEQGFLDRLSQRDLVISPRFHGTCLSLILGKRVVAVESNTHKLQGLYEDMGLDASSVLSFEDFHRLPRPSALARLAEQRASEPAAAAAYVRQAPAKIAAMFDAIRAA